MQKTEEPIKNLNKIEFIQAFRGIAALLVVLYHGARFVNSQYPGVGDILFEPAGPMGVVLFFIISGFIMVHTTLRMEGNPSEAIMFFIKRFSRIWPVYAVATLIYVLIRFGVTDFLQTEDAIVKLVKSLLFLPLGGDIGPHFGDPVLNVGWTLNYEIYFYIVFGLSMLFARWRWWALAAWLVATLLLLPWVASGNATLDTVTDYGFANNYVQLMTSPIIWQFFAGVVIGLIYHSRLALSDGLVFKLLIFSSASLVVWQYMSGLLVGHGILNWGLSLIPFVLVLVLYSKNHSIAVPAILIYLGDISFSLYIWHPIAQESNILGRYLVLYGYGNLTYGYSYLFLTTATAIVVAMLSHRILELWLSGHVKDFLMRLCLRPMLRAKALA